jgi:quinolinate synthase
MAEAVNDSAAELARDIAEGLASATTATERVALVPAELVAAIKKLKAERDAVILAHYYVAPEVQAVADYVGDSFYLAKLAKSLPQQTIVLCGVEFMGESAKLLNPEKTVLLPEPCADCPMAHMVKRETVDAARAEYGDDLAVVCYVNSTVEIKSWSDVCVTSSNAVKIVSELPQHNILFIPDQNLGRYVAEQVPDKNVLLNKGYCPRHHIITPEQIIDSEEAHPDALVLAHPECKADVLAEADYIGSTAGIIKYAEESDANEFIIVTVAGVLYELERRCKGTGKKFFFPATRPTCINMDMITLEKLVRCLETGEGEVEINVTPEAADQAKLTLDRMLEYAA